MNRRIVTVRNRQGHALHCMLWEPPGGARGAAMAAVLLCPGIKMRVGPHRLYRKLAPAFLSRGVPVMCVDFNGLGDSEGELPQDNLQQIYREMDLGRHVDDARSAVDWLESECGIRHCIVGGLCGAAMTGLLLAHQDPRVAALYTMALPVSVEGNPEARSAPLTRRQLRHNGATYLRKLLQPSSWTRLLSLKSDYHLMWRMLMSALGRRLGTPAAPVPEADVPPPASPPPPNFNPKFAPAFFGLLRSGRPALLIFSERDRLRWDYEEHFAQPWERALAPYQALISKVMIPNANHILGDPAWVAEAGRHTGAWLDRCFSVPCVAQSTQSVASLAVAATGMTGASGIPVA